MTNNSDAPNWPNWPNMNAHPYYHGGWGGQGSWHPGYHPSPYGQAPHPYSPGAEVPQKPRGVVEFLSDEHVVKGVLVGAALAALFGNERVQKTVIKSAVRVFTMFQSGVEEVKERFRDVEAELHSGSG